MQAKQTEVSMTPDATATGKRPQCTDNYRNYERNHDVTTHMVHHWRQ